MTLTPQQWKEPHQLEPEPDLRSGWFIEGNKWISETPEEQCAGFLAHCWEAESQLYVLLVDSVSIMDAV